MVQPRDLPTDPSFARLVEQAEVDAWLDLDPSMSGSRRFEIQTLDGAILLIDRATEWPLSRTLNLGVIRPATPETIRRIVQAARDSEIETLSAGVSPIARPGTLARMLTQEGFRLADRSVIVARDTAGMMEPDSYFRIRQAALQETEAVVEFMHRVSHAPLDWCRLLAFQLSRERWRFYMAWEHDVPCGLTGIHLSGDMAWLSVIWVSEEFRNRGTQAALIAYAVRDAEANGAQWITSSYPAAVPGRTRNFERLGFSIVYLRNRFVWEASSA